MRRHIICGFLAALFLAGCGGNGGGHKSTGGGTDLWQPAIVNGSVHLNESRGGANLVPAMVRTALGPAQVKPDGSFSVIGLANSPSLATVEDAEGKVLGYAFVEPGKAQITDELCASTLAYMAMRGQMLPAEGRREFWNELQNQPEISQLASTLGPLLASGDSDPEGVKSALRNALQPLLNRMMGTTRGISIDPSNGKSGIEVLQQGLSQIYVKNHYRRRAHAFVERVEVTLADGTVQPRSDSVTDFPIDPITNPNSLNSAVGDAGTILGDYFSGNNEVFTSNVAWIPTTTSPLELQVLPADARSTKYRVVVVGPGGFATVPQPLTQAMRDKFDELVQKTAVDDVLIPAFFTALGPMLDHYERVGNINSQERELVEAVASASKDIIAEILGTPAINAKLEQGDIGGAVWDTISLLVQTDAYSNRVREVVLAGLRPILQRIISDPNFAPDIAIGDLEENADRFWGNMKRMFTNLDLVMQGADWALMFGQMASSQGYEEFFVNVTKARVILTPPNGHLSVTQSMDLTASVPDATGDEAPLLEYRWRIVSGSGVQLRNATNVGQEFTSSSPTVTLESTSHQEGTVTIEVEAVVNEPGNEQSLGKATSQVNIVNDRVVLSPAMSSIRPGEDQVLIARINSPREGSHYLFKWRLSGGSGAIDEGPDLTSRTSVTFTAGSSTGSGEVTVDAYQNGPSGVVRIGSATATIRVENEPTILPASYSTFTGSPDAGRGRVVALVKAPRVAGATSYRLVGVGGYDSAYFGDHISFGISPFNDEPNIGLIEPDNEVWVGLSGWDGPESGIGGAVSWMDSRFAGFSFYVEVTR